MKENKGPVEVEVAAAGTEEAETERVYEEQRQEGIAAARTGAPEPAKRTRNLGDIRLGVVQESDLPPDVLTVEIMPEVYETSDKATAAAAKMATPGRGARFAVVRVVRIFEIRPKTVMEIADV